MHALSAPRVSARVTGEGATRPERLARLIPRASEHIPLAPPGTPAYPAAVRLVVCCSALLTLAACGGELPPEGELTTAEPAPAVGDAGDSADRACQVILRSVMRSTDDCSSGACVARWTGALDVAVGTVSRGAVPAVLVGARPGAQWVWQEVRAAVDGAPRGGFQRYTFAIADGTLARGPSASALARFTLAVAPFVRLGDGSRAFDHNRVPGDLDTYVLNQANRWTIGEAAATCPATVAGPRAELVFSAGWTQRQQGALVPGSRVRVSYDPARLPQCHGDVYAGRPAWSTMLSARWLPSGTITSEPVTACSDAACSQMLGAPADLLVPAGATAARAVVPHRRTNLHQRLRQQLRPATTASRWRLAHPAAVGWAGDWGSSFARDCARRDGIAEPVVVDGYTRERACAIVYADVWAPGVTDGATAHPEWLFARVAVASGRRPLAAHAARARRSRRQQPALPLGAAQDRAGLRHLVRAHVHVPVLHRRPGVPEHRPGRAARPAPSVAAPASELSLTFVVGRVHRRSDSRRTTTPPL
jgi:hypothetical protein